MTKKLLVFICFSILSFANDTVKELSTLKDFVSTEDKISLVDSKLKSTGYKFLESELNKVKDLASYNMTEIYNNNISTEWKVSIFDIDLLYFDGSKENKKRKIFYNKSLIVNDIFNENADSIGKKINIPLMSDIVYNKEYLLLERDIKKPSPNGINMVVFTNSQCPFCKQYVPAMLDFAINNNMSLYVINLSNKKFNNSEILTKNVISFLKFDKRNSHEKINLIKKIYTHNFTTNEEYLIEEFSKLLPVDKNILIDKDNLKFADELLEINNKLAKKLYVSETPTVYIDGVLFNDYGGR